MPAALSIHVHVSRKHCLSTTAHRNCMDALRYISLTGFVAAVILHLKEKGITAKASPLFDNAPAHSNVTSPVNVHVHVCVSIKHSPKCRGM